MAFSPITLRWVSGRSVAIFSSTTVSSGRRVQARGVREVGLEHDVVLADLVDEAAAGRRGSFSNQNVAYQLSRKYSDGSFVQLRGVLGRVLQQLVVHRLEDERDPADAALDRHHLEVGVAVEHAREYALLMQRRGSCSGTAIAPPIAGFT